MMDLFFILFLIILKFYIKIILLLYYVFSLSFYLLILY